MRIRPQVGRRVGICLHLCPTTRLHKASRAVESVRAVRNSHETEPRALVPTLTRLVVGTIIEHNKVRVRYRRTNVRLLSTERTPGARVHAHERHKKPCVHTFRHG